MSTRYVRTDLDAVVEFSDTACMQASTGEVYSAFQRNSYIARVTFGNGRIICVALPAGARSRASKGELVNEAVTAASADPELPNGGAVFL